MVFDAFSVSASGMEAQRVRMNTIASNLANVETTRAPGGGAYRRKDVVFAPAENTSGGFSGALRDYTVGVKVAGVVEDSRPLKYAFEPGHPDADTSGYVAYPNINAVEEMVNMISASRSYEANATAFKSSRDMAMRALEIVG